jgi:hypothetical protein
VVKKVVGSNFTLALIVQKNLDFGDSMICMVLADDLLIMSTHKKKKYMLNPKSKVAMFWIHLYNSKKLKSSKCHYIYSY